MFRALTTLLKQITSKKSTNLFPSKRYPKPSVTEFISKGILNPPVEVPKDFRGKLEYYYDKCIGCSLCIKVCPANVIKAYNVEIEGKKKKRIVMYVANCIFCSECVSICPTDALAMSPNFAMSNYDKYGDDQIIGLEERKQNEIKK